MATQNQEQNQEQNQNNQTKVKQSDFHIISLEDAESVLNTIESERLYEACYRAVQIYKNRKKLDLLIKHLGLARPIFIKRLLGIKIINFARKISEENKYQFSVEDVLKDQREIDLFLNHKQGVFHFIERHSPSALRYVDFKHEHLRSDCEYNNNFNNKYSVEENKSSVEENHQKNKNKISIQYKRSYEKQRSYENERSCEYG